MTRTFSLIQPVEDDWELVRELRLRMVLDTPIAFLETADQVREATEEEWRSRVTRSLAPGSTRYIAVAPDGRWVGCMSAFLSDGEPPYVVDPQPGPTRANLVGVFVDPVWRGDAGVADALLVSVSTWVREQDLDRLYLHVGEANLRARRFYAKKGFQETGVVVAVPQQPGVGEVEMLLTLPG
ncbi:MAG TPA: GNAT family N-acetyltransferase [Pseudolysinimonas sp.]|jgi:GNAT superfamily N-acetyltransferase|nr:GNAT family N-acetyltransferase [Pseudolysinimonas sp.]